MPGPVQADGLFFACAKSKVKSTHKGKPPYGSPAPPDKRSCSGLTCTLFRPQTMVGGCAAVQHLTFFEKCAASGTGMRGIRPRAAGPFSDARKGTKSAHKGSTPYVSPGRVPAFGWVERTRMSQPAPTCFLPRQAPPARPGLCRKTPLLCARSGRASQLAGVGHTGRGR